MQTYFASPERASDETLKMNIEIASQNPVIDGILGAVGGLLAILNKHRQIVALNEKLLHILGIEDEDKVLGLRPGEALNCTHAHEMPGGCGTSKFCSTCGAAIAIVTSLQGNHPVEKTCALKTKINGKETDLFFSVRAYPISFNDERLLLLFLQDITRQQHLAMLERVFFHDINNIITGVLGTSELLTRVKGKQVYDLSEDIHHMAIRLAQEVKIQQYITQIDNHDYKLVLNEISLKQILNELKQMFKNHSAAKHKTITFTECNENITFKTDISLLNRVLGNMITNALEASKKNEIIKFNYKRKNNDLIFFVWNQEKIPAHVANRIFQRNFSTKQGLGRGLGTYSMKILGEKFLKGKVAFVSSEQDGTTFSFTLPIQ